MNFVSIAHQLNSLFIYLMSTQNPNGELKTSNNKQNNRHTHNKEHNTRQKMWYSSVGKSELNKNIVHNYIKYKLINKKVQLLKQTR